MATRKRCREIVKRNQGVVKVKYDYKNTGIEWLGEIPKHWKYTPIKKEFKVIPSNVDKKSFDEETEVKLCNYVDVYYNDFLDSSIDYMVATANEGEIKKFTLKENDVLITKDSEDPFDIAVPALITEIQDNFLCGYHLSLIRSINQKIYGQFLFWSLKDEAIASQLYREATGVTRWAIASRHIKNSTIAFPPLPEQKAIADYLDKACRRIDSIIEIKQKQLENLHGIRKAKIYQAVTQGIKLVSEWKYLKFNQIEKIPINWKMYRIKTIGKVKYGLGQPPNEMTGGLPIIRATNVYRGKIDTNNLLFVDPDDVPYERDPVLKKDDIIVVRSGAYTADSAIIPQEFDGSITGYDMVLRCNKNIFAKFVAYALLSKYILDDQLILLSLRAAQPHLNREELSNSRILLPDYNEQKLIAAHLDIVTEKIDKAIQNIKTQITTLQAYRESLIHECVTGKKQVWEGEITTKKI